LPTQRNYWLSVLFIPLIIGILAGLTWFNFRFSIQQPGGNDFLARWTGAHYWVMKDISPYDPQVSQAAQKMIYGRLADPKAGEDVASFVYPLFSMIFFAPFGALDYTLARALWMTLLEVCLVLTAIVSIRLANWKLRPVGFALVILFSLLWYNGVRTLILGQFSGVNALLIVAGIFLIYKNHDFEGGVLLVLSLSKPQMSFLIVPFVFLWALSTHRTRLVFSMLGTFFILMIASLAIMPDWLLQWLRQLMAYPSYTARIESTVSVIGNSLPGISRPLKTFLYAFFGLYLLFEWVRSWGKDENWFLWTAMITLVVTNFVAPRTATPHYVALLPALFMVFSVWQDRWGAAGMVFIWGSLALLLFGQWALFLGTLQGNEESAIMYPIIPTLSFFGLWWVRWWVVRPPRLYFDQLRERWLS
jgi:hypothetical protein